jgi:hypothetical protein
MPLNKQKITARIPWTIALIFLFPFITRSQQIWFSPGDDVNTQRNGVAHPDYMNLFSANTWPTGAAHINVMMVRDIWLLRMPTDSVNKALAFLKQRNISIASPMGLVANDSLNCGAGVEGIGSQRGIVLYPREMKKKGIPLDYVVIDEPLFHAHDYDGNNACKLPVKQVADAVARNVKMIRSYYPNVRFVLVEPPQALTGGPQELAEFLDYYKADLNEYPVSVRFDIAWQQVDIWHTDWRLIIHPFIQMLRAHGIGYGIIFNAGHPTGRGLDNDKAWVASAKSNVAAWMATVHDVPNQIVIQTWTPNPVRNVPESDPNTMTGYLKWFVNYNLSTQNH